jgi:hypothetical protein
MYILLPPINKCERRWRPTATLLLPALLLRRPTATLLLLVLPLLASNHSSRETTSQEYKYCSRPRVPSSVQYDKSSKHSLTLIMRLRHPHLFGQTLSSSHNESRWLARSVRFSHLFLLPSSFRSFYTQFNRVL